MSICLDPKIDKDSSEPFSVLMGIRLAATYLPVSESISILSTSLSREKRLEDVTSVVMDPLDAFLWIMMYLELRSIH